MNKYNVTLTGHYEKTIAVYADSPEQAAEKVQIILFDTDLIDFFDEDFVGGEADIMDASKSDCDKDGAEDGNVADDCCSDCLYLCPVCKACMY